MAKSLDEYYYCIFWINYAFYLIYFVVKYPVATILWFMLYVADKTDHKDSLLAKVAKMTIPMRWLILQLFGGPLGIVERRDDEHKPDQTDNKDIPTLYIRNHKVEYGGIMVLCLIIISFGILTFSSAINLSLLKITHVCSEDPYIDCYPQLITDANYTLVNLSNITINTEEPILDCAFWNSEGVSSQVTFVCFQFVYNVEVFFATLGGLSTALSTTMKLSAGVLLWLSGYKKYCDCCKDKDHNCKWAIRITFIIVAAIIEIVLAALCMIFGLSGALVDDEGNSLIERFIAMHAVEALIIFSVVATLLWLPWDVYAEKKVHSET